MTRFWRNGFWRTSVNGNTHWVEGHWVDRDEWGNWWSTVPSDPLQRLVYYRADTGWAKCFVEPNATCPICGDRVYFYQNEHGSRVFFDDIGPPWPVHACTAAVCGSEDFEGNVVRPRTRPKYEIQSIISARQELGIYDPGVTPYLVRAAAKSANMTIIFASSMNADHDLAVAAGGAALAVNTDDVIWFSGDEGEFEFIGDEFEPVRVQGHVINDLSSVFDWLF